MNDIVLIGLNHNTAPVELRECIAFSEGDTHNALAHLAEAELTHVRLRREYSRIKAPFDGLVIAHKALSERDFGKLTEDYLADLHLRLARLRSC